MAFRSTSRPIRMVSCSAASRVRLPGQVGGPRRVAPEHPRVNNPVIPMDAVDLLDPRPWYDFEASERRRSRYSSPGSPSNNPTSRS